MSLITTLIPLTQLLFPLSRASDVYERKYEHKNRQQTHLLIKVILCSSALRSKVMTRHAAVMLAYLGSGNFSAINKKLLLQTSMIILAHI
jgi:hypothetical protein